jgi:hypothetical protein
MLEADNGAARGTQLEAGQAAGRRGASCWTDCAGGSGGVNSCLIGCVCRDVVTGCWPSR